MTVNQSSSGSITRLIEQQVDDKVRQTALTAKLQAGERTLGIMAQQLGEASPFIGVKLDLRA